MDTYRFIGMVIFLNLIVGIGITTSMPSATWEDFLSTEDSSRQQEAIRTLVSQAEDDDTSYALPSDAIQEPTGGYSSGQGTSRLKFLWDVLTTGVSQDDATLQGYSSSGIIRTVAWIASLLFLLLNLSAVKLLYDIVRSKKVD